jgi:hypothetical protein
MKEVLVSFFIPSLSKPESKSVVKTSGIILETFDL